LAGRRRERFAEQAMEQSCLLAVDFSRAARPANQIPKIPVISLMQRQHKTHAEFQPSAFYLQQGSVYAVNAGAGREADDAAGSHDREKIHNVKE
jgi:hypothetical protein